MWLKVVMTEVDATVQEVESTVSVIVCAPEGLDWLWYHPSRAVYPPPCLPLPHPSQSPRSRPSVAAHTPRAALSHYSRHLNKSQTTRFIIITIK